MGQLHYVVIIIAPNAKHRSGFNRSKELCIPKSILPSVKPQVFVRLTDYSPDNISAYLAVKYILAMPYSCDLHLLYPLLFYIISMDEQDTSWAVLS